MSPALSHINERLVDFEGKALLYFGGCDYFRLSSHLEVLGRLNSSIHQTGHVSVGASRNTTGNHKVFETLETELATFLDGESAVLTGAGYLANLSLAQFFREHASHLIIDSMAHSSLKDAARLSGIPVHSYQHRNAKAASEICNTLKVPSRCFLLTDGVFGLDGTVAPLSDLHTSLSEKIGFVIDDAHGFGVMGVRGKGTGSEIDWGERNIIRTISLAKALGCHGGAVVGGHRVIEAVKSKSPVWSGHTPFPVGLGEACSAGLKVLIEDQERHQRLKDNLTVMDGLLRQSKELPGAKLSFPVFSFAGDRMKDPDKRAEIEHTFIQHGVYPSIVRYPGISEGFLIRLAISSEHQPEDLNILKMALTEVNEAVGLRSFYLADQH